MKRRLFISSMGSLLVAGCGGGGGSSDPAAPAATPTVGDQSCNISGATAYTAAVNMNSYFQTQGATQLQYFDEWCWAACISMLFAYRGHPVDQATIVDTVYGAVVDFPAPGMTVASALNRSWIDNNGVAFTSTVTGLYDAQSGIVSLTNDMIVGSLSGGTPLILGANSHARVLLEVNYANNGAGTGIYGGAVFDPGNGTVECLNVPEMTPADQGGSLSFLASVSIH